MRKFVILFCLVTISMTGCGDKSRPKDLPELYPCTISITQNNAPLVGAVVNLVAVDKSKTKYQASTVTDETGKAVPTTYGYEGVPAGKYKVCVWKTITEGVKQYTDNYGETVESFGTEYRTVEPKYSSADTTPFEIDIKDKNTPPATFDVGKAVKIRK